MRPSATNTQADNYSSTGWTQLNVVVSGTLCWGCNGSGRIDLDSTTIGTGAGVFGFGLDILGHSPSLPYDAFVTFGDGSTQNFTLPLGGPSFFGVTSSALIKSVAFGPNGGSSTTSGSFQIDNVSIGNEGGTHVPEPGAALLALAGLGVAGQVRRKHRAG